MGLLSELKRRNVFRMAALYLVAAWLIMQVAEVVIDLAVLPDWIGQVVLALLAIGFPIALVFSWFYELTPEGLSLEINVKPGESITHITGRRMDFIVIALLCAAVIVFAYDKWWMTGEPIASLAVLPLKNVSAATEQAHFAEGMTEALTTELGQISSLRVISRTSAMRYKSTEKLLPEICRELDVDAIVEGSVQQAGDEVKITLQLIDGRKDRHLWAGNYRRGLGDIFTLQSEVAREIAAAIHATLTPEDEARLAHERATRGDAIRLWVFGNHHLKYRPDVDSIGKSEQALAEAIKLDPDFGHAHAALSQVYLVRVGWHIGEKLESLLPLAKEAAETALQLDPYLADAHYALGEFYLYAWDWEAADRAFGRGVELNPNHSHGLMLYVNFLLAMGRVEEAVELARIGVAVDPFWPGGNAELAWALWISGRDQEAMRQYERVLELTPDSTGIRFWMALVHIKAGRFDEALPLLEMRKEHIDHLAAEPLGLLGRSYGFIGRHDEAREILSRLQERSETEYVPAIALAHIYVGLGDHDKSIEWLAKAYDERNFSMTWLRENPAYDQLRDDPRFQELVARMNFPPRP